MPNLGANNSSNRPVQNKLTLSRSTQQLIVSMVLCRWNSIQSSHDNCEKKARRDPIPNSWPLTVKHKFRSSNSFNRPVRNKLTLSRSMQRLIVSVVLCRWHSIQSSRDNCEKKARRDPIPNSWPLTFKHKFLSSNSFNRPVRNALTLSRSTQQLIVSVVLCRWHSIESSRDNCEKKARHDLIPNSWLLTFIHV